MGLTGASCTRKRTKAFFDDIQRENNYPPGMIPATIYFVGTNLICKGQDPNGEGKKHVGPALYDVRGNDDLNIKAVQVFPVC